MAVVKLALDFRNENENNKDIDEVYKDIERLSFAVVNSELADLVSLNMEIVKKYPEIVHYSNGELRYIPDGQILFRFSKEENIDLLVKACKALYRIMQARTSPDWQKVVEKIIKAGAEHFTKSAIKALFETK